MAILKVLYEGAIYEIHTCFSEENVAKIQAVYPPDGVVDIAEMLERPRVEDVAGMMKKPSDQYTSPVLRDWLAAQAKRKANEAAKVAEVAKARAEAEAAAKVDDK